MDMTEFSKYLLENRNIDCEKYECSGGGMRTLLTFVFLGKNAINEMVLKWKPVYLNILDMKFWN